MPGRLHCKLRRLGNQLYCPPANAPGADRGPWPWPVQFREVLADEVQTGEAETLARIRSRGLTWRGPSQQAVGRVGSVVGEGGGTIHDSCFFMPGPSPPGAAARE